MEWLRFGLFLLVEGGALGSRMKKEMRT